MKDDSVPRKRSRAAAFDPRRNYRESRKAVGYVPRRKAVQADYDRVGFMSGLEVHQQLKTRRKLFCNCPAGRYNRFDDYDAEIIRHMRPTLSELGEYDGTALMEFRTRKQITYRIKNETACTYDIDDTPPFPMNREALEIALEVSLLCRLNIVGEVEIMRKQYLDGSIPTGFQRTAILGVEGEIPLRGKTVRLIQLSIEEDACREVSDVGHHRTYQTDRLGMPLIETVTYPDFANPDEVREGAEYIRFLNRSTAKVFTGMGAGREDVNVSCRGGDRVEIKGVSHNSWIPELTHNEVFRQWALLRIRDRLNKRVPDPAAWKPRSRRVRPEEIGVDPVVLGASGPAFLAINLPDFRGILSFFTQPGKMFADELEDRLKVIACIERPNMVHSELFKPGLKPGQWDVLRAMLKSAPEDAQLLVFGPEDDMATALETVDERCRMAFSAVPRESRKSFPDGTTIFERVLPGPDRMYPDTDSPPIPLEDETIEAIRARLPVDVSERFRQFRAWGLPSDIDDYLLRNNLGPLLERIIAELELPPRFVGTLFGHDLKRIEGIFPRQPGFGYSRIHDLLAFLKRKKIRPEYAKAMLVEVYMHPRMDFDSVLSVLKFKRASQREILGKIPVLVGIARKSGVTANPAGRTGWIMGELRRPAFGSMDMAGLRRRVEEAVAQAGRGDRS